MAHVFEDAKQEGGRRLGERNSAPGNLWLPVAAHFTWNLVLGPVLGLTVSGSSQLGLGWRMLSVEGPPLITGGDFGPEGGLMVTLTTALLVTAMFWMHNRRPASGPPETSPGTT